MTSDHDISREGIPYRRFLIIAAVVYLLWWGAVEWALPGSFNPIVSRLVVAGVIASFYALSFVSPWLRRHIALAALAGDFLITAHYFYLFYGNNGGTDWIVGSFITVAAVSFFLFSVRALNFYSIFVLAISTAFSVKIPSLRQSVFLPGMLTIILQAHFALRSRVRLIRELSRGNQRFQLLFHSTFEGVLVHEKRTIVSVNEALAQMLGYAQEELIGQPATAVIHPAERPAIELKIARNDGDPYETLGFGKDGSAVEIEVRAKDFNHEGRPARLVTFHKISDRKRAEREEIRAASMLESVRIRDEFISVASHELKTPLTSLKLQSQLIEHKFRKENLEGLTPARASEFIVFIMRQIDRLTRLVETMMDASRISSGRLTVEKTAVDLAKMVREIVELKRKELKIEGVHQLISEKLPNELVLPADPFRLEQVIENLLSNAIRYGKGNPIEVTLATESTLAVLVVKDGGIGIAPDSIERIFHRFERAVSGRNIAGLGLGLYIAKQIVEMHGGTIGVESQIDRGSKFQIHLPLN